MSDATPKLRLIGLIMAVVLAGHAVGALIDMLRLPGAEIGDTPVLHELLNDRAAPQVGPADARVTVVIITDYQCPVCRIDHPGLARVIRAEPGTRFVFREWAILGPASREAARVALAAAYQDRYPSVRDALMTAPERLDAARIRAAATAAGADWRRLEADLASHGAAIDAELARTSRQAFALGLPGTPAYLVGNRLVIGRLSERQLRRLIERAR